MKTGSSAGDDETLGVVSGAALGASMVVGIGIFSLMGMALDVGGLRGSLLGWLLAAVIMLPLLIVFAQIGRRELRVPGLAAYIAQSCGPRVGHGAALLLLVNFGVVIATTALVGGSYLQRALGLPTAAADLLALAILALAICLNVLGTGRSCLVSKISLGLLAFLLGSVVVAHPQYLMMGLHALWSGVAEPMAWRQVWYVASLTVFAFLGWENLSFTRGEFRHPQRDLVRSYGLSFLMVLGLYLCLACVAAGARQAGVVIAGDTGAAALFAQLPLGAVLTACVGLISLANATAWLWSASRMLASASRNGLLPAGLEGSVARVVSTKTVWVSGGACMLVIGLSRIGDVTVAQWFSLVTQGYLMIYLLVVIAHWRLERGLWSRVISLLACGACLVLSTGLHWTLLMTIACFLLGVYRPWRRLHGEYAFSINTRWLKAQVNFML